MSYYVLGGAIPMYVPPPTIVEPTPEPQIDWDAWAQITANYEAAKDQDGGSIFSQVTNAIDDSVNETIPGGWATVAAVVAPQLAPLLTGSALTAAQAAALSAGVSGTSSIIEGDPIEVALQKAALSGAGSYGSQYLLGGGTEGFTGASETGLATLPSEGIAADVIGATLLNEAGTTGLESVPSLLSEGGLTSAEIDQLTREAVETGTEIGAYTTPIEAPVIGQPYDAQLIDPTTGQPFGSIEAPLVDNFVPAGNEFAGMSPTDLASLDSTGIYTPSGNEFAGMTSQDLAKLDSTGIYTPAGNEFAGMTSEDLAKLDSTGTGGISISQALRGLNLAKGLLGSGQEQAVAPATQFKGTRVPSGQVDYSGILSLLQMQSPQRRSLLG